jgi:hypothetical protein
MELTWRIARKAVIAESVNTKPMKSTRPDHRRKRPHAIIRVVPIGESLNFQLTTEPPVLPPDEQVPNHVALAQLMIRLATNDMGATLSLVRKTQRDMPAGARLAFWADIQKGFCSDCGEIVPSGADCPCQSKIITATAMPQ